MSEDTLTVVGRCTKISEQNGWTEFEVDVGTKWPIRMSTKIDALVEEGRAVKNNEAIWKYKESQGNENPNKPGTYYMNRRFQGVELITDENRELAEKAASTPRSKSSSGGGGGERSPDERGSIERQTIVKATMHLYPQDLITTDAEFAALLGRLAKFVAGTPTVGSTSSGSSDTDVEDRPQDDDVPPHSDDDIPF